jgi:uncharacterized membrane protein
METVTISLETYTRMKELAELNEAEIQKRASGMAERSKSGGWYLVIAFIIVGLLTAMTMWRPGF